MLIKSKAYGEIDVDDRQLITFPSGLLGFENLKEYILLDAAQRPFYWLQSRDIEQIAFILIKPEIFKNHYKAMIMNSDLSELELQSEEDENTIIFSIVTFHDNAEVKMTANLQGPLVINKNTRCGKQCISQNNEWRTRHNILQEMAEARKEVC